MSLRLDIPDGGALLRVDSVLWEFPRRTFASKHACVLSQFAMHALFFPWRLLSDNAGDLKECQAWLAEECPERTRAPGTTTHNTTTTKRKSINLTSRYSISIGGK